MYRILHDQKLFRTQCLINGRWRDAADKSVVEVVNPANGKLFLGVLHMVRPSTMLFRPDTFAKVMLRPRPPVIPS